MVIDQRHSIGDILFLQPMFKYFKEFEGKAPIVPLRDHLMWLEQYIPDAIFIPESVYVKNSYNEGIINTMHANQIFRGHPMHYHGDFENCMLDKYRLASLDPMMWKTLMFQWYTDPATRLMSILGLTPDSDYILVNEHSQAGQVKISTETQYRVIRMNNIEGFTLIDWFMVIMFAKEIHTVSTSLFYLMECIDIQAEQIYIYPRPNEDGLRGIKNLNPKFSYIPMP